MQATGLKHVAVNVKPPPLFTYKAAALMLAHSFAPHAKTGNELDLSSVGTSDAVLLDLQP